MAEETGRRASAFDRGGTARADGEHPPVPPGEGTVLCPPGWGELRLHHHPQLEVPAGRCRYAAAHLRSQGLPASAAPAGGGEARPAW